MNSDFYIYLDDTTGVVIDIFYADSIINFINVINIKLKRYTLISEPTFLVIVGNDSISQSLIDEKVANRRVPIPTHISLASEEYFKDKIVQDLRLNSKYRKS